MSLLWADMRRPSRCGSHPETAAIMIRRRNVFCFKDLLAFLRPEKSEILHYFLGRKNNQNNFIQDLSLAGAVAGEARGLPGADARMAVYGLGSFHPVASSIARRAGGFAASITA